MTIPSDMLTHMLIGAVLALVAAWKLGYLRISLPTPPQSLPPAYTHPPVITGTNPSYKSVISIPHEVAITPQAEVK